MKYNIKKESDEELKYYKGLLNQSYQSFFVPTATEITNAMQHALKAEKAVLFMHNKEIDHLYSLHLGGGKSQD